VYLKQIVKELIFINIFKIVSSIIEETWNAFLSNKLKKWILFNARLHSAWIYYSLGASFWLTYLLNKFKIYRVTIVLSTSY